MVFREFTDQAGVAWEAWEAHPSLTERRILRDRRAVVRDTPERRTMHVPRRSLARDPKGWITFRSRSERRAIKLFLVEYFRR